MKLIRVAAAVLNQTPLDWAGNQARIREAVQRARDAQVSILCLPELCITGYGCEDAFHAANTAEMAEEILLELAPETRGMIVSLGLPVLYGGGLFNAACLLVDGNVAGLVGKQNLAGEGIHYEPRWFKAWPNNVQVELGFGGRRVPLGDLIFDCGGVRIGFEVCEDAWVADRPGAELAKQGADVILNPSASHFAFAKHAVRQRFVLEGSRAFRVAYVYANLLGNEAGRAIYDGDAMIASGGRLLAIGPRFSFADVHVTDAVVDVQENRMQRARSSSFQLNVAGHSRRCVEVPFRFPDVLPAPAVAVVEDAAAGMEAAPPFASGPAVAGATGPRPAADAMKHEEFTRAVALGLFDYLRKSRSRGFVVSLSGGADSAAVATLCALQVQLGVAELGLAGYLEKFPYWSQLQGAESAEALVREMLTCVYQATRHSGDVTRRAAQTLAEALAARFHLLDLDPLVQAYVGLASSALGRELTWERDDIPLQNIQARSRAPSVWLLANLQGALLLSTSNRSEAAVGYATMDGDTCGGLSPIAGIDKAYLRQWLRWMEETGPQAVGPVPALGPINRQQPTAELRPAEAGQTDESDLMPYELLDAIERAAIRDKLAPLEVYQRMRAAFPQYRAEQLRQWLHRFFQLWCRNQWKRERYAPSFHLDDENLDPKTWCRFPILSGGFVRELARLDDYVARLDAAREETAGPG